MTAHSHALQIACHDHLKDNARLYAHKARRKKIALVKVEMAGVSGSDPVTVDLDAAELIVEGKRINVESPKRLIRRFTEFTWDFLFFLVIYFHPILSLIDLLCLLGGPLYNRRLRRQLRLLADGEMTLMPGDRKEVLLGFRPVRKAATAVMMIPVGYADGRKERVECAIAS